MTQLGFAYFIGLGNKGKEYASTRHNVGFLLLDFWQKELGFTPWRLSNKLKSWVSAKGSLRLYKPDTYMNLSGLVVNHICKNLSDYQLSNQVLIIHDDLDIPLGRWKIQLGKSPKQHKGILSIEKSLKTNNFWRLRIGVENRQPAPHRPSGEEYVVQTFTLSELKLLKEQIFPQITKHLDL